MSQASLEDSFYPECNVDGYLFLTENCLKFIPKNNLTMVTEFISNL